MRVLAAGTLRVWILGRDSPCQARLVCFIPPNLQLQSSSFQTHPSLLALTRSLHRAILWETIEYSIRKISWDGVVDDVCSLACIEKDQRQGQICTKSVQNFIHSTLAAANPIYAAVFL